MDPRGHACEYALTGCWEVPREIINSTTTTTTELAFSGTKMLKEVPLEVLRLSA